MMPHKRSTDGLSIAFTSALVLGLALAAHAPAYTQEDTAGEPSPEEIMKTYQKLSEPGPEHKVLAMRTGNWKIEANTFLAPGAPPAKSEATSSIRALLGGRYFREAYTGEFLGQKFSGVGTFGYDKGKKKYFSTWIDSMSTGVMFSEGTADPSGKVITYIGEYYDPMREQLVKLKYVLTIKNRKTHTTAMYEIAADGSEHKGMEMVYTRVARAKKQGAEAQGAKKKPKQGGKKAKEAEK